MSIEWVAQTDAHTCANCGKTVDEGQSIVGDFDQFYHKDKEDCQE